MRRRLRAFKRPPVCTLTGGVDLDLTEAQRGGGGGEPLNGDCRSTGRSTPSIHMEAAPPPLWSLALSR